MSDIRVLQLNSYVAPKLVENKSKNWVLYGNNNEFYQYIIDRNEGSVTNAAINKSYVDLMYGKGIYAKDANRYPEKWAEFYSLIKASELRKIVSDFQIFGEATIQVVKTRDKKKISGIYHIAKNLVVPAIENAEEEIESYFYSKNWAKLSENPPIEYPAFGTSSEAIEIYDVKPYSAGCNYFANPDYLAGLPYAKMEEEIANFCINAIKKGLSAGYIINIPDGQTLTPEEKQEIENKIKAKLTGSPNALSFVISFNSKDADITVIPFPVNDQQHKQWDFLTAESKQQIMTAHRVVSPMLFGIKDNTGFGNNADELDTAEAQLMKRVIAPKQHYIIDAIKEIVAINGIHLDLYFKPLTEIATTVQMSAEDEKKNLDTTVADELINLGEDNIGEEWELIEKKVVESEADLHFTSTGSAFPNAKSEEDGKKFKIRFRYIGNVSSNSRQFCTKMISANKIYRLEDINRMSSTVVNEGFGPNGTNTYNIFLYKGGARCKHAWQREIYRLKTDVNSPLAETISPSEARKEGEIPPKYDSKVYQKPADMPYEGFLPPSKK